MASQCGEDHEALEDAVRNVFANRSPATLAARFSSVSLFLAWARRQGMDVTQTLPPSEDIVYKYMESLRKGGAPPTRAKTTMAALNFLKGTVGYRDATASWESPRVQGSAERSFARKRNTKQAAALPASSVAQLERTCVDQGLDAQLRLLAGHCLIIHGRMRASDARCAVEEPVLDTDEEGAGFIEMPVKGTTNLRGPRAGLVWPVVASAVGISGTHWAAELLRLRVQFGLDVKRDGFLFPALTAAFSPKGGAASTAEVGSALRALLTRVGPNQQTDARPTAHSCKVTVLSWSAKAGLPKDARRMLGHHFKPADKSVMTYSRDMMAGPLRELEALYGHIRRGMFMPDQTRSGRWMRPSAQDADRKPNASSESAVSDNTTSSAESSEGATGDVEEAVFMLSALSPYGAAESPETLAEYVYNPKRYLKHIVVHDGPEGKNLACGRKAATLQAAAGGAPWMATCKQCLRASAPTETGPPKMPHVLSQCPCSHCTHVPIHINTRAQDHRPKRSDRQCPCEDGSQGATEGLRRTHLSGAEAGPHDGKFQFARPAGPNRALSAAKLGPLVFLTRSHLSWSQGAQGPSTNSGRPPKREL